MSIKLTDKQVEVIAKLHGLPVEVVLDKAAKHTDAKPAKLQRISTKDCKGGVHRRALVAKNVRAMSKGAHDAALKDGTFALMAKLWGRTGTGAFEAMRESISYGYSDEQRTKLSNAVKAKRNGQATQQPSKAKGKPKAKGRGKAKMSNPTPANVERGYLGAWTWPNGFAADVRKSGVVEALRRAGRAQLATQYARSA